VRSPPGAGDTYTSIQPQSSDEREFFDIDIVSSSEESLEAPFMIAHRKTLPPCNKSGPSYKVVTSTSSTYLPPGRENSPSIILDGLSALSIASPDLSAKTLHSFALSNTYIHACSGSATSRGAREYIEISD
jgi:hypothetical protein